MVQIFDLSSYVLFTFQESAAEKGCTLSGKDGTASLKTKLNFPLLTEIRCTFPITIQGMQLSKVQFIRDII